MQATFPPNGPEQTSPVQDAYDSLVNDSPELTPDIAHQDLAATVDALCSAERRTALKPVLKALEVAKDKPASSGHAYHAAFPGGLILHIHAVTKLALETYANQIDNWIRIVAIPNMARLEDKMGEEQAALRTAALEEITREAIVTTAICHDLDKLRDFEGNELYVDNILKAGNRSEKVPFKTNSNYDIWGRIRATLTNEYGDQGMPELMLLDPELGFGLPDVSSGLVSLALAKQISPDLFSSLSPAERQAIAFHGGLYETGSKKGYSGKEHPLTLLLHFADMMCSRAYL